MGIGYFSQLSADNQTPTVSKIHPDNSLPFQVKLKLADFQLPMGVQSYVHALNHDKFLIITGRIDGLHGFVPNSTENFPTSAQNTNVFVVDPIAKKTYTRSLLDSSSGLTQEQVDLLSVTAAQAYQKGKTLYITGGYGLNSATNQLDTKNALTAIDIPGLIHWVVDPSPGETAAEHIRQIFDDLFKVTGGYMNQTGDNPTLLIFGHQFNGYYDGPPPTPPIHQLYTEQVIRFFINDDGVNLSFTPLPSIPTIPDPNFRRRDLNVLPFVKRVHKELQINFMELSGVFTLTTGVWTVPVEITADGIPSMADPNLPSTFKQGMNNYDCATFSMFSEKTGDTYIVLLGGMSFGFFTESPQGLVFKTNDRIPFISQTTTVRIDKRGKFKQYFMRKGGFPDILSQTVNPVNTLLFGSECEVFFLKRVKRYVNDVVKFDSIKKPTVIGYVIGGIQSTMGNTSSQADSFTSPYIFKVILEPKKGRHCK